MRQVVVGLAGQQRAIELAAEQRPTIWGLGGW